MRARGEADRARGGRVENLMFGQMVAAAYAEPRLRQLYPVTSHWNLWFSRCATSPFEPVGPAVAPGHDGLYRVRTDGRLVETRSAREAAAIAAAAVPEGVTPTG